MAQHPTGYSRLQIGLHWLIMLMVLIQIVMGEEMVEMVDAIEEGETLSAGTAFWGNVHFWVGLAVLGLMLARLAVRLIRGVPAHAPGSSPAQDLAASVLHWAFYVVLLATPVSGLVAYYSIADVGDLHGLSKPLLIVLIAIHAGAALFNQFVRKDGTLTRMLRPQG